MKTVTVVGGGFSGLSLAYHLLKQGFGVHLIEKQDRLGGLVHTYKAAHGLVGTAANALLADPYIESLFEDLDLEFAEHLPARKKRYIYWEKPTRWPLGLKSSARLLARSPKLLWDMQEYLPYSAESVREWGVRVFGEEFEERLLAPALQGVYAGETKKLSATLILKGMFQRGRKKSKLKGSVAPEDGMGALIEALEKYLERKGAVIERETTFRMPEYITSPLVLGASAWAAAEILKNTHPEAAKLLSSCESLSLVSVTCFYEPDASDLQGFGCLFPQRQRFHSLGVLFNSSIFANRSEARSETWIMGGARDPEITAFDDEQLLDRIRQDRERLCGSKARPLSYRVTRWGRAIPYYTVEWERTLGKLQVKPPVFLHGNYLGDLGLARIHRRSMKLARQIKEMYG